MGQEKYENKTLQKIHEEMAAIHNEALLTAVQKALNDGTPALDLVDALRSGLKVVGDDFEDMVRFLPELIMAANLMQEAMKVIDPELKKLDISAGPSASIVLANIQGDIHDIGRNILGAVLRASGFDVHDIGHDVKADTIIDKALAHEADIIGLSSLLTTSLPYADEMLRLLKDRGLRDRFKVVMGGGAVTPEYCEEVGADAYGKDAGAAVDILQNLISEGE
jgi:methylmalonyl-CoA mutase cobalamin-binding domain/chain